MYMLRLLSGQAKAVTICLLKTINNQSEFTSYHSFIPIIQYSIFTMKMKSVMAGEYTAPPAHGPIIMEI